MNKNTIGFALITAGALDIILYFAQGYGWTEFVFGYGIISRYSWGLMIAAGIFYRNKYKAELTAELQTAQLNNGEEVIFTEKGNEIILTLTSSRLMYSEVDLDNLRSNSLHIPSEPAGEFLIEDIKSIKKVMSSEVSNNALGKKIRMHFGVQLETQNGVFNLPCKKADILLAHLNKYIA